MSMPKGTHRGVYKRSAHNCYAGSFRTPLTGYEKIIIAYELLGIVDSRAHKLIRLYREQLREVESLKPVIILDYIKKNKLYKE